MEYHSNNNTLRTVTAEKRRRARTKKRFAEQKTRIEREREREKERKRGTKRGARGVFFFLLRLFHLLLSLDDDDSRIGIYKTQ